MAAVLQSPQCRVVLAVQQFPEKLVFVVSQLVGLIRQN